MSARFATWFLLIQISLFPSMSAKLGHVCLLGLCSWGWDLCWQKSTDGWRLALGKTWLVVSEASSGGWECAPWHDGALWVIWLQCDGDCFLHGFYKERFVALHFAAPSVSGWKNLSVGGKYKKRWKTYSTIPLENPAALLGPSVEETYDDTCFSFLGCNWNCSFSRNFLVSRVWNGLCSLCRTKIQEKQETDAPHY